MFKLAYVTKGWKYVEKNKSKAGLYAWVKWGETSEYASCQKKLVINLYNTLEVFN